MSKAINILVIGPVTNEANELIGGATISFGYLIDTLKKRGDSFYLINTKPYFQRFSGIKNPLNVFIKVMQKIFWADVLFLNSSRGGTKYLAPILYFLTRLFSKKFIFRPFGGDINEYTKNYSDWTKWLFQRTVLKADILFLQTSTLMDFYRPTGANIIQLPTSRMAPADHLVRRGRPFQKRFIFLGFVNTTKGVDHLLEAQKALGPAYTIQVYGPIRDNYDDGNTITFAEKFRQQPNFYQGILQKEEVLTTLSTYDVLILPTYYEGEGYPGVLVEAYSLGLPVITTNWKAIPEIVQDQVSGLLIEPKSTEALIKAIAYFNEDNYAEYSKNARKYFKQRFSAYEVNGKAIDQIYDLFKS